MEGGACVRCGAQTRGTPSPREIVAIQCVSRMIHCIVEYVYR